MATGDKLVTLDGLKAVHDRDMQTLDVKYRFANTDFNYGELKVGGINSSNQITTNSTNQRHSETYWPVIEGPVTVQMGGGLVGYLRLYNSNKEMLTPVGDGANESAKSIAIGKNASLTLTMKNYNADTAYFRFYMSSGTTEIAEAFVPANARIIMPKNIATDTEMTAAENTISDHTEDISALQADVSDLQDKTLPNVWGLFKNAVCIGDSLTRGFYSDYADGERNRDFGYPSVLASMTGMNVWNFGASGATPASWLDNATFAQQEYSKFDVAFVAFRQNTGITGGGSYTKSEYQTQYLNVLNRLKDSQTGNPDMVIFCLSNPGNTPDNGWTEDTVTAAVNAEYTHVYYLDISEGPYTERRTDGTHLDAIGYAMLAETVKIAVEKLYVELCDDDATAIFIPKTRESISADPVNGLADAEQRIATLEAENEQLVKDNKDLAWTLETLSLTGYRAIPQEIVPGGVSSNGDNNSAGAKETSRRTGFLPVIENPVIANVNSGITAYIRLYDASKALATLNTTKDGAALPGVNSTYNYIQISKSTSPMNINMRDYNADAVYYRFSYTCGNNSTDLLTDQCAFLATHKNLVTNGEMQAYVDEQIASVMALIATL